MMKQPPSQDVARTGDGPEPTDSASEAELKRIREDWDATVKAPDRIREESRESLRRIAGISAPSAVVRSAEGVTQFDGLHVNNNGDLSVAARDALKRSKPQARDHRADPAAHAPGDDE